MSSYVITGATAQRMGSMAGTQLGARLIERRQQLGIEQKEAALMCGVSQPAYHRWEHGRLPDEKYLTDIARFLGVTRGEVVLLRSGEDPTEFVAGQIEQLSERASDMARTLRLLRPSDPPDPA